MEDNDTREFDDSAYESVDGINLPQNMLRNPNQNAIHRDQSSINLNDGPNDEFDITDKALVFNALSLSGTESNMGTGTNTQDGQCRNSSQGSVPSPSEPVYNWQATKTTVKERFAFMFNNEILCDVHFIVGRETELQRIPAHRFVLSVGSVVFDAMFNGTLATRSDEIELPDVEPAAFLALLRFLYSDEVHIGPETVMTTLYTAKKYAVPALEKHCVDFLKSNLGSDNAFMLLTQVTIIAVS
uniref:BTB/POZ domain-containing protein 2 n=1 Tax=Cacopsylla melanoneura TaxID=428564 RepID=A0A8D8LNY1_9HEMI